MNLYHRAMMSAPPHRADYCLLCGDSNIQRHHVVPRSQGGILGPTVPLCGLGNTGGCHGMAHSHRLHFRYIDRWECCVTEPMKYERALDEGEWRAC